LLGKTEPSASLERGIRTNKKSERSESLIYIHLTLPQGITAGNPSSSANQSSNKIKTSESSRFRDFLFLSIHRFTQGEGSQVLILHS